MKKLFRLFSLTSLLSVSLSSCSSSTPDFNDNITPNNPSENTPADDKVDEDTPIGDKEEDKDTNPSQDSESEGKEEGESPKDDDKEPQPIVIEKFTVTWIDGNGEVLERSNDIYKGSKPTCSKTPKKLSGDERIQYKFIGWSTDSKSTTGVQIKDLPAVTKDTTYFSIFQTVELCIAKFIVNPKFNSTFEKKLYVEKGKAPNFTVNDVPKIAIPSSRPDIKEYNLHSIEQNTTSTSEIIKYYYCDKGVLDSFDPIYDDYTYVINYAETIKTFDVSFLAPNGKKLYSTNPNYGSKLGKNFMELVSSDTFSLNYKSLPSKVVDGIKYGIVGWSENENATSGISLEEISKIEIKKDYTFYPVFQSTGQYACFVDSPERGSKILTFEELLDAGHLKFIEEGKLTFNISDRLKTEQATLYLPDNKGINVIDKTANNCFFSKISFPNTLKELSSAATFSGNNANYLTEVDFSRCTQGVILPRSAFNGAGDRCGGLKTIKGFNNIKKVGYSCFEGCDLSDIDGNLSSLEEIGGMAFKKTNIQSIVINSNTTVGDNAFGNCKNLKTAIFNEGFSKINKELFSGCTNLESVTFPKSAKFFTSDYSGFTSVFASCNKLKNVTIHKDNKDLMSYGSAIVKKTNGAGNTLVFANEFSTVIPDGVNKIPQGRIIKNYMKEITLPSGLWDLSNFAFEYCYSLETINFKGTKAEFDKLMGSRAFQFYDSDCYGYSNPLTIKATDQTFKSNF